MAPIVMPPTQPTLKLSKLDVVTIKNWLKRVSGILTDMKLDNELKLRVATRLMDKSAATWWDNLKFHFTALVT